MTTSRLKFSQTVIAASLMAIYGSAWSAEEDAAVAELIQPSSEVSIGAGSWNSDRQNLGRFDGMRKKDSFLLLDADIRKRDEATGTWLNLNVSNFGTDNREIRGEYLQQGNVGVVVEYTEFRADKPYTVNSNNVGIGTSSQYLGANIPATAIGSGTDYQLGTDRKKTGISLYKTLTPALDINAKFSSERKTGNELTTSAKNAPNGNRYDFVADLIDRTTTKAEVVLSYNVGELHLNGGYNGSWFKNNTQGYIAFNATPGATTAASTIMTQPLDNRSHQLFVDGSYRFTPTTRGTFKLSYTQDIKDEMPPTSNIASGTNTYGFLSSLGGRVDTTLLQLGLTAKPMPKLSVVANLRYYDRDDKTNQAAVLSNTSTGVGVLALDHPSHRSYKTTTGKLEGTYLLPQGYAATAAFDYSTQQRTVLNTFNNKGYNALVPDRGHLTEPALRLQLRKSLGETLNGSLAYLQSYRKGSGYQVASNAGGNRVSPVLNADRDRQKVRLSMDWTPVEKLGVQFVAENAEDLYGNGDRWQGIQTGKADLYSLDASYQVNENWKLSGWYSVNTNNASFANYSTTTLTFLKQQNDTGEAFGLNLGGKVNAKTTIGAEFTWSQDNTDFIQSRSDGASTGANAPNISSKSTLLKLYAVYGLDKSSDIRVDVGYQKWQSDDWQWTYQNGLPWQFGNTTTADGTSVITANSQSATFVGARYIYKFQ